MLDFQIDHKHDMQTRKSTTPAKPKVSRVEVYWHTVRYRTVVLYVLADRHHRLAQRPIWFSPKLSQPGIRRISDAIAPHESGVATITARQARFVNLDGKVQVKKVNSVQWVNADYQIHAG